MPELTRQVRDRRIAVMNDVLAQLAAGRLTLRRRSYLSGSLDSPLPIDSDAKPHVDMLAEKCDACMLGGALLSQIRLYDAVRLRSIVSADSRDGPATEWICAEAGSVYDILSDVFDRRTLVLMECAFERDADIGPHQSSVPRGERERAAGFGERFLVSTARGRAIARNIVDHDGEFVVPAGRG